jgi:hypothetical protein
MKTIRRRTASQIGIAFISVAFANLVWFHFDTKYWTVIAARIDRKTRRIRPVYIVSKLSPRPTVYRLEKVGPLRR